MSYGRRDVRGYVRAKFRKIELPETTKESALVYEEYTKAVEGYEHQFFKVLGAIDGSHLIRVAHRVAHSGRQVKATWRAISKRLQREYKLPAWELIMLRERGLAVAKAYKALVPFLVRGFWRG